jgi:hypothetical protein
MSVPDTPLDTRQLLRSVLPASLLVAVASTVLALLRAFRPADPTDLLGLSPGPVVVGVILSTVTTVPFLLALLLVVTTPSRRVAVAGAGLVYAVGLTAAAASRVVVARGPDLGLAVLALPLPRAATVLAVAAAVWLAYGGGTERLRTVVGGVPRHPLFAQIPDEELVPALTLRRGLLAAGLAGLVGAGGLVVAGGLHDVLTTLGRLGATESPTITFSESGLREVGVPLTDLPVEWLIEASFLLAVLFVAGPRCSPRNLLKGIGLLVAVQSAVILVPAFLPPFEPVFVLGARGPLVAALPDAILLVGIAFAVRLSDADSPASPAGQPTATADS